MSRPDGDDESRVWGQRLYNGPRWLKRLIHGNEDDEPPGRRD